MKRFLLSLLVALALIPAFAQLQSGPSSPVNRFLDEYVTLKGFIKSNNKHAELMYEREYAPPRLINGVEYVDAFISFKDKYVISKLKARGVIVNCVFDDFLTAQIPMNRLETVSRISGVDNVEMSRMMEMCTDSTLRKTYAGMVLNGPDYGLPQAYDGSGVVVGIIDCGFDYQHSAFRRADNPNQSRIMRVYDPMNTNGHPVTIGSNTLPGSVFMGAQIDTLTTDCDETHGTHTACIAAGTHEAGYGGMAPGADIVLCSVRSLVVAISTVEVVNSMKYIYSYADSVGKPCVISLSVSSTNGPHDGTDFISKAVAQMVGPGRVFVIAAGNNGNRSFYCYGKATPAKPVNMLLGYSGNDVDRYANESYYYGYTWVESWLREQYVLPVIKFHIFDRTAKRIVWESDYITQYKKIYSSEYSQFYKPILSVDSVGYMEASISLDMSAHKYKITTKIRNLKTTAYNVNPYTDCAFSRYIIGFSVYSPRTVNPRQPEQCTIDSWQCNSVGVRIPYYDIVYVDEIQDDGSVVTKEVEGFYTNPSSNCSIGTYAVHDSVISAGGYIGRNKFFSYSRGTYMTTDDNVGSYYIKTSYQRNATGPTQKALPTVVAPSVNVISAISRYSETYMHEPGFSYLVRVNSKGCWWGVMTGTSMAAPTVAGIIAQWLQIKPDLCPGDIKRIIAETAIKDNFTTDPDSYYRYGPNGKIDALAGARYILDLIQEPITKGDVNGDGKVSMLDMTILIDYVLGIERDEFIFEAADLSGEGRVSIYDISLLADLILGVVYD